jgi:CRP-like cAMP-binding protein
MLVLLDSIACSTFFRQFHVTWREQILRRIELVKIKKGVTLFDQNEPANCAYFVLSGRLSNEILINNQVSELLVETTAPQSMKRFIKREKQEDEKKGQKDFTKEYMKLKPFMPGAELHVDVLIPSRKGVPLRVKRDRKVVAMDNVHMFKLSIQSFKDAVAVQDVNEDWGIWNFFRFCTAGGLGEKVFSAFSKNMEQQWKEMWHLKTFPGGTIISKQGDKARHIYVLSTGDVDVLRLTNNKKLLVIDKPRSGEFILTSASEIISSVLRTKPIYKTMNETSLVSKAATDCYEAAADLFYNFCYKYKWFAKFLAKYFHAIGLSDISAKTSMLQKETWNQQKSFIIDKNVGKFFRNCQAKGLQMGTVEKIEKIDKIDKGDGKRKKKKRVHHLKPLKNDVIRKEIIADTIEAILEGKKEEDVEIEKQDNENLIQEEEEIQLQKKKEKKKRKKKIFFSNEMLKTSNKIYERLDKAKQQTATDTSNTRKSKSLPILQTEIKERLQIRAEKSFDNHRRRNGTHRLLRGSSLRYLVKK